MLLLAPDPPVCDLLHLQEDSYLVTRPVIGLQRMHWVDTPTFSPGRPFSPQLGRIRRLPGDLLAVCEHEEGAGLYRRQGAGDPAAAWAL